MKMKRLWTMALGFFFSAAVGQMALAALPNPFVKGRIVSIDCRDKAADIETTDCKIVRVFFYNSADCKKNSFGDVIKVSGEKNGSDISAESVQNVGLPKGTGGTITSIDCRDREIEVTTACNRICRVGISEQDCRNFHYGDKVDVSGEEVDRDTGCVEYADSIRKVQFKMKKPNLAW